MTVAREGGRLRTGASIKHTPLGDVMLVLLIIFLIRFPLVIPPGPLELPRRRNQGAPDQAGKSRSRDRDGDIFWA